MSKAPTVGVAVLTLNAKHHLQSCLPPFLESPLAPKVLVVDSSSTDGTGQEARRLGAEVLTIAKGEFNHGLTREKARKHLGTDIAVMVTQDAYPVDHFVLEKLVLPILEKKASISYARQIPHDGAGFFEAFARQFNYPKEGHIRGIEDLNQYGVYTFFCSNSCAAYSNQALDEINGFRNVLLGEDTVAAALLLRKGHKVAYAADALVKHSHDYTLLEEFQRYFDTGLARKDYHALLQCGSSDRARGSAYAAKLFEQILKEKPSFLPYGCAHIFCKWLGYRLGQLSYKAPLWWKKVLSSQKFYWNSQQMKT